MRALHDDKNVLCFSRSTLVLCLTTVSQSHFFLDLVRIEHSCKETGNWAEYYCDISLFFLSTLLWSLNALYPLIQYYYHLLFIFWCHPEKPDIACLPYCANAVCGQRSTCGNYSTEYWSQLSRVINVSQKFILLITHSLCNPPDPVVSIAKCDALILKSSFASNRTVIFKSKLKVLQFFLSSEFCLF